MNQIKKLVESHRPPNIAISLLITGFGIIQSANVLIDNTTIRSIIMGVAQSLIFIASLLKKHSTDTVSPVVPSIEPFTPNNANNPIILDIPNDNDNVLVSAPEVHDVSNNGQPMIHENLTV